MWLRAADHLARRLLWWLLAAALAGVLMEGPAAALADRTPLILAVMVGGLGLGLPLSALARGLLEPRLLVTVLATQVLVTPVVGWLLAGTGGVGVGAAIQAAAPAEITSPLLVALAGGSTAAAVPVMALTVLLAPVTMPPVLAATAGATVAVDARGLLLGLLVTVAVPVLAGAGLHTAAGRHRGLLARLGRGLSAAMVILLVFAVAGRAARQLAVRGPGRLLAATAMAALLIAVGFTLGAVAGRLARLDEQRRRVALFAIGMREFGVATAVALGYFTAEAALVPAVYGPLVMIAAAALAHRLAPTGG